MTTAGSLHTLFPLLVKGYVFSQVKCHGPIEDIPCSTKGTVPWRSVAYSDLGGRNEAAGYRSARCCINHHDDILSVSHKFYMTNHWYSAVEEAHTLPRSDI